MTQIAADPPSAPLVVADDSPRIIFFTEFLTSCGTNFLQVGIFFYTARQFNWSLGANFALAAGQGAVYVFGALAAQKIAARFPQRRALACVYLLMSLAALCVAIHPTPHMLAIALLSFAGLSAVGWPMLESLASAGAVNEALSRRIMIYNLVWSGSGAIVLALNGTVIEHWSRGVFVIPAILHAISALLLLYGVEKENPITDSPATGEIAAHADPEIELLRVRTLALWLSRVALPATYVVIYSLAALMPSLPVLRGLSTAQQTLAGATWMGARWIAFLILGLGMWWHTRPRILLVAAALMLVAFAGVVIRPSDLIHCRTSIDLPAMLIAQLFMGAALGMIYHASLYFGMVLSDGSTEHGGYHEALIGLGSILGPGVGAITQWICPGNVRAGITAVGTVITLSVLATFLTPLFIRRNRKSYASR